MPRQWDQRAHANSGHHRPLCVGCDGGLAKISRRHPDRASSSVGKLHYDVGGTSSRALRQHRKLAAKQGMPRVSNRDMGHHPIEDCGALQCTVSRRSPTPSSIASCTTPIGWNWTGRPCVKSMPPSRLKLMLDHPRRKPPAPYLRQPSQQKGIRNDRHAQLPARPGGSTGTSRARRCASRESAPRRARVPPIDYRDGLSPCFTSKEETDITTIIQRRPQHPRRTGRDQSEQLVAIRRNEWSRSSECAYS